MSSISPAVGGLIAPWVDAVAVDGDPRVKNAELPDFVTMAKCVQAASENLYKLTGARWQGLQTVTVRPHRLGDDCTCDQGMVGQWATWTEAGASGWTDRLFPEGWGCGCAGQEQYVITGGRVSEIVEVMVDGEVLDPSAYVLYDDRRLVRVADDGGTALSWPCCQRIALAPTEVGTWQLIYAQGQAPPMSGVLAAYEYSVQIALRYDARKNGKVSARASRVTREGVDITIESEAAIKDGRTGFPTVDDFIEAWNPHQLQRRAQIYSPDDVAPAIVNRTQT